MKRENKIENKTSNIFLFINLKKKPNKLVKHKENKNNGKLLK